MGQYYRCMIGLQYDYPVGLSSWDYDCGAKLMEHSFVGNGYVDAAIRLMKQIEERTEKYNRIAWVGDYADSILPNVVHKNKKDIAKCTFLYAAYVNAWMYRGDGGADFIPEMSTDDLSDIPYGARTHSIGGIVCNMDTKEYVRVPPDVDEWPWSIHPLPLLTCIGNGCGGGDYHCGDCMDAVGRWAGDHVTWVSDEDSETFIDENVLKYLDIVFKEDRDD